MQQKVQGFFPRGPRRERGIGAGKLQACEKADAPKRHLDILVKTFLPAPGRTAGKDFAIGAEPEYGLVAVDDAYPVFAKVFLPKESVGGLPDAATGREYEAIAVAFDCYSVGHHPPKGRALLAQRDGHGVTLRFHLSHVVHIGFPHILFRGLQMQDITPRTGEPPLSGQILPAPFPDIFGETGVEAYEQTGNVENNVGFLHGEMSQMMAIIVFAA